MYILDTDHLSLIQHNGREGKQILARLRSITPVDLATTVITYEEQVRGRLNYLSKAKTIDQQVPAYEALQQLVVDYRSIVIVSFNKNAALIYQRLQKSYPRLGSMDLKIAAICLANNATLITRNTSDFDQIEGLVTEDWTVSSGY
jgi:tRNA(fMet)-specific endonuclease VapC